MRHLPRLALAKEPGLLGDLAIELSEYIVDLLQAHFVDTMSKPTSMESN